MGKAMKVKPKAKLAMKTKPTISSKKVLGADKNEWMSEKESKFFRSMLGPGPTAV